MLFIIIINNNSNNNIIIIITITTIIITTIIITTTASAPAPACTTCPKYTLPLPMLPFVLQPLLPLLLTNPHDGCRFCTDHAPRSKRFIRVCFPPLPHPTQPPLSNQCPPSLPTAASTPAPTSTTLSFTRFCCQSRCFSCCPWLKLLLTKSVVLVKKAVVLLHALMHAKCVTRDVHRRVTCDVWRVTCCV